MPVVFTSLLNIGREVIETPGQPPGETVYTISQTPQVYLDFMVHEDRGELVIDWDAMEELFPAGLLDDMFRAYQLSIAAFGRRRFRWSRTLADNARQLLPPESGAVDRRGQRHERAGERRVVAHAVSQAS